MSPSKLVDKSNYYLFKADIMPAWEDPNNGKGGSWVLQLGNGPADKKYLDEIWLYTILECIGEGCTLTHRSILSIDLSKSHLCARTRTVTHAVADT